MKQEIEKIEEEVSRGVRWSKINEGEGKGGRVGRAGDEEKEDSPTRTIFTPGQCSVQRKRCGSIR